MRIGNVGSVGCGQVTDELIFVVFVEHWSVVLRDFEPKVAVLVEID